MKNVTFTFTIVGIFILSLACAGQSQMKIGHVNFEEILVSLPERDSALAVLKKESNDFQIAYEELGVQYNNLYKDYQEGLATFSSLVRKMKEDELLDKQKRMTELEQEANLSLQKRNNELMQPIIDKITRAIEKVGIDNAFTYILDVSKGSVAFVSKESQNLTKDVLKILKQ
ncbi:MAG: OmpH family outer membrane protein [Bacteroidales bacterium]